MMGLTLHGLAALLWALSILFAATSGSLLAKRDPAEKEGADGPAVALVISLVLAVVAFSLQVVA